MSENEIREPVQKRSIETKDKIIEAGFDLICHDGFYNTNTSKIAKKAGAYLGFLIIAAIGGEWIDTSSDGAIIIDGREVYVCDFAANRLMTGSELNAVDYYKKVRTLRKR